MNTQAFPSFSLSGKVAVLTGAAGFFGRYFARALLEAGADHVCLLDQNAEGLTELGQTLTDFGFCNWTVYQVDQNEKAQVVAVFEQILFDHYSVDILINNAYRFGQSSGFSDPTGRVDTATRAQLTSSWDSVVWSLEATQLVLPEMKSQGSGVIINIASMYALVAPNPILYEGRDYFNPVGYSMAKSAILAETRFLAAELGPFGIRVNALAPGPIPNNEQKSDNSEQNKDEEFIRRLTERTLLKRLGHPQDDLTGPLVFLASDASRYVTGHVLVVDGGWTVT